VFIYRYYYCYYLLFVIIYVFICLFYFYTLGCKDPEGWKHRCSQGCSGCTCTPSVENFFRRNSQGKFVSAPPARQVHPQAEQESILGHFFAVSGRFGAWIIWTRFWRRRLRKGQVFQEKSAPLRRVKKVVNFVRKKCTPKTKSWLRLWLKTKLGVKTKSWSGHSSSLEKLLCTIVFIYLLLLWLVL